MRLIKKELKVVFRLWHIQCYVDALRLVSYEVIEKGKATFVLKIAFVKHISASSAFSFPCYFSLLIEVSFDGLSLSAHWKVNTAGFIVLVQILAVLCQY